MSVKLRYQENKGKVRSYYLDVYDKGNRQAEYLGIHIHPKDPQAKEKLRLAQLARNQREIEMISQSTGTVPAHLKRQSFKSFAKEYLRKYRKRDKRVIQGAVNYFYEAVGDNLKVTEINPNVMSKYRDYLNSSGLTGETPHSYWNRFKKVLKQAMIEGYFINMPTIDVKFKTVKEKNLSKNILDIDELRTLKETKCGNAEVKKAFLFACYTGLGLAELKDLTWGDVQKDRVQTERKKTGTRIDNKLPKSAQELIGRKGHIDDYVFDIAISDTAINKNIRNWVKRAKINKDITFYCARHTFAVLMLKNGADIKTVADVMGHRDIKTTVKYLNYITDLKDRSIDNLPAL